MMSLADPVLHGLPVGEDNLELEKVPQVFNLIEVNASSALWISSKGP